jgi:purine nucleosidase
MRRGNRDLLLVILVSAGLLGGVHAQQPASSPKAREKIIIDTDIGDDIDDAFAIALALRSPELEILGIATEFGDTGERAKIVDRMLGEVGRPELPVAVGVTTVVNNAEVGSFLLNQRPYGEGGQFSRVSHPDAIEFILQQIRRYPDSVTLVAIGPLFNVGELIDKSPETFRKLKRVVMMGGSIEPIKADYGNTPTFGPIAEWNVKNAIPAAQKLFLSGVPLYVMPLDSTLHLRLDEVKRNLIFAQGTPLTDALTLLYHQWSNAGGVTPVLFDPMTIAYIASADLCPTQPMHIRVDDEGFTRVEPGKPNAQVCLHSDPDAFMHFYLKRVLGP